MMTKQEFELLAEIVAEKTLLCNKEILTVKEAAMYMGVKRSYLYTLMRARKLPYYKPTGKLCYFERSELKAWMQRSKVVAVEADKKE